MTLGVAYALTSAIPDDTAQHLGRGLGGTWWRADPPKALGVGMALALMGLVRSTPAIRAISRWLIQAAIVLLGFWISLEQVGRAGGTGLAFSIAAIALVLAASVPLMRLLGTPREAAALLGAGTAICGGSAIAATGAAMNAAAPTMAVTTAIVFLLNAAGVYAYPVIGSALGLTQHQFGAWAAVGLHDVPGVVAAAKAYGDTALADATVIKLTRVLWIAPVAVILAAWYRRQASTASGSASDTGPTSPGARWRSRLALVPVFVWLFGAAVLLRALADQTAQAEAFARVAGMGRSIASVLMTVALFLIGTALSRGVVREIGWIPGVHALLLWLLISAASLAGAVWLLP